LHICEITNASRTLLCNIKTLQWEPRLLKFFGLKESILPKLVSTSEVYGKIARGALQGVPIGGLVGDQQGALIGNKCLRQGEAKCTYGTGAFLLFCTGEQIVYSQHGLLSTVCSLSIVWAAMISIFETGRVSARPEREARIRSRRCHRCRRQRNQMVKTCKISFDPDSFLTSLRFRLRDSMGMIKTAEEINDLAKSVPTTSGVYFVTAFSGLLAPYWDPAATGLIIGLSSYTTPAHLCRATLEANAFQTRAVIDSMELDSRARLAQLKVDGGMTNGTVAMEVLADLGGFDVVRPEMRESTALGSALLAGSAIGLFGWDITKPETLAEVNTKGSFTFAPNMAAKDRATRWKGWQRAVERARGWEEGDAESDEE
jgi:glycerol kinase